MTTAVYNRVDQDSSEVSFIQFGSNVAEAHLRDELLNGQLDYHFAISSLSVPLNRVPIHPVDKETTIFQLVRRNQGGLVNLQANLSEPYTAFLALVEDDQKEADYQAFAVTFQGLGVQVDGANSKEEIYLGFAGYFNVETTAPLFGIEPSTASALRIKPSNFSFSLSPNKQHFSVNDFFKSFSDWCKLINMKLTQNGLFTEVFSIEANVNPVVLANAGDETQYLTLTMTADTTLQIKGTSHLWDCFSIEVSNYGIGLLGLDKTTMLKFDERYFITRIDDVFGAQQFDINVDPVVYFNIGFNTSAGIFSGVTPLYQSCDQRVSVSMSCHLPMESHVIVNNGVQASSRIIAKAFFENNVLSTIEFDGDGNITNQRIRARVYADQEHMIKVTDQNIQWNRLASSYRLRYLRFYLHMNYKLFGVDTFSISEEQFKLEPDDYWQFTVRFISDY